MSDKPKSDGSKLSMLIEPRLNRIRSGAVPWNSREVPADDAVDDGSVRAPRSLAETRVKADVIDLVIVVPVAVALLFGLTLWYGAVESVPEGDYSFGALVFFIFLIPYCLPLAAFSYGLLAYGIFGTTLGKRKMKIIVTSQAGGRASRCTLQLRPLANWGSFLAAAFLVLVGIRAPFFLDDHYQPAVGIAGALAVAFFFLIPIAIVLFHIGIRVSRHDTQTNIIDRLTGTKVAWRGSAGEDSLVE